MPAKKKKMPREMKETKLVMEASVREAPTELSRRDCVVEGRKSEKNGGLVDEGLQAEVRWKGSEGVSMAAEAPFKNHKPRGRGSQPRRRNQGAKLEILFLPKSELDSSNSELDRSLDELSIRGDYDVERELDPENKNGSELKNEVENKVEESHADVPDREGNSVYSRLHKQMRDVGEPELSEEQLSVNDQLQEDELLALEAIYGENVLNLERWKGPSDTLTH
ncbi:hypothetical protein K1719_003766 [Acacia pycnantha]|nr:hypothetical protein K1719_003766 [Acacia pycnantha]